MEPIGGYFSLELQRHEEYHKDAIKLNTGRNCLEYILRSRKYAKVYIPFYTCEVILEPFQKLGVEYEFYHINLDFEITDKIHLQNNESLLYTNYYGLKQRYSESLAKIYGQQLIIDNTQAFYAKPIYGIDTFYTCRKFFGVPDGAYLYTNCQLNQELEQDISYERMIFLTKRIDLGAEAGYKDFREQSHILCNQPIKRMSKLTERLMQSIDYEWAAKRRKDNYNHLHDSLKDCNLLHITLDDDTVPLVYPFLSTQEGLRDILIQNKVFIACYWPNVFEWAEEKSTEKCLAKQMLPIPIDQRYGKTEMGRIIKLLRPCDQQ